MKIHVTQKRPLSGGSSWPIAVPLLAGARRPLAASSSRTRAESQGEVQAVCGRQELSVEGWRGTEAATVCCCTRWRSVVYTDCWPMVCTMDSHVSEPRTVSSRALCLRVSRFKVMTLCARSRILDSYPIGCLGKAHRS